MMLLIVLTSLVKSDSLKEFLLFNLIESFRNSVSFALFIPLISTSSMMRFSETSIIKILLLIFKLIFSKKLVL